MFLRGKGSNFKFYISNPQRALTSLAITTYKDVSCVGMCPKMRPVGVMKTGKKGAPRILLTTPVAVASAERSFSRPKLIKNILRSTITDDRFYALLWSKSKTRLPDLLTTTHWLICGEQGSKEALCVLHSNTVDWSCRPVHNTKSVSVYIINTSFWLVHGDVRGSRTGVWRGPPVSLLRPWIRLHIISVKYQLIVVSSLQANACVSCL